jgi:hypothetical protein
MRVALTAFLLLAVAGCALPLDEGRVFKERLTAMVGRPAAELPELLAMDVTAAEGGLFTASR